LAIVRFEGSCHTLFSGGKRCATMDAVGGAILVCRAIAVPDLPLKLWQRKEPLVPCSHPCAIPVQYKSREKAVEGVYRGCIPAAQRVGILAKRYGSCGTAPKCSANADFRCHTSDASYGTAPKGVAPAWTEPHRLRPVFVRAIVPGEATAHPTSRPLWATSASGAATDNRRSRRGR
jgi:hypothetical protein